MHRIKHSRKIIKGRPQNWNIRLSGKEQVAVVMGAAWNIIIWRQISAPAKTSTV